MARLNYSEKESLVERVKEEIIEKWKNDNELHESQKQKIVREIELSPLTEKLLELQDTHDKIDKLKNKVKDLIKEIEKYCNDNNIECQFSRYSSLDSISISNIKENLERKLESDLFSVEYLNKSKIGKLIEDELNLLDYSSKDSMESIKIKLKKKAIERIEKFPELYLIKY